MKPRRRNLPKLRPVECPACHKVPKCSRHVAFVGQYYEVKCSPYCGRLALGDTPKQAIDAWNRKMEYERRI